MDEGKENKMEEPVNRIDKMPDMISPQKSILDFFASPNKQTSIVKKPKDLMGYYGTVENTKADSQTKEIVTKASKSQKNKRKNQAENDVDKSDKTSKKIKTGKKDDSKSKNSKCASAVLDGKKHGELSKKPSDQEKNKEICAADSEFPTTLEKQEAINEEVCPSDRQEESQGKNNEICYEDFIRTLEDPKVEEERGDDPDDDIEETKVTHVNGETSCQENDIETNETKTYPSVASFFTKVNRPNKSTKTMDPKTRSLVTIKAVIHENSKTSRSPNIVKVKSPRSLSNNEVDEEIELLGSETIEVEENAKIPTSKKQLFGDQLQNDDMESATVVNSSINEDSCMSGDSSICVVEEAEDTTQLEKKKTFLQSTSLPEVTAKTRQGTLSFFSGSQKKNSTSKSVKTRPRLLVEKSNDDKEIPVVESLDSNKKPLQKKTSKQISKPDTKTKTPNKKQGRKSGKIDIQNEDKTAVPKETVSDRRRSLRSRYRVSLIDDQKGSNTPIRMKIFRCSKSSSSGTDDAEFTPKSSKYVSSKKSAKMSKAKELVEKAKTKNKKNKKKHGKKNDKVSVGDSERRRSKRLSDRHVPAEEEQIVIDSDEEEDSKPSKTPKKTKTPRKVTSTPLKGKGTPSKRGTPSKQKNTPKKSAKTMASIFLKGAKPPPKPEVALDPEAEKLKRAFLMSGVPEELKRQTVSSDVLIIDDPAPFPVDNHTQQKDLELCGKSGIKLWDLPDVKLSYKDLPNAFEKNSVPWKNGLIVSQEYLTDCSKIKDFKKHEKIEDEMVEKLLSEISSHCPTFPVKKVFETLRIKKEDYDPVDVKEDKPEKKSDAKPEEKEEKKGPRRSLRRKRISIELPDVIELGCSPEPVKPDDNETKQDVFPIVSLTEKYAPVNSSEIIGNSGKVKKLRTWLVEWKQCLDREARKARKLALKQNKGKTNKQDKDDDWWGDDGSDFDFDSDETDDDDDSLCNTVMLSGPCGTGKTATVYALAQELGFKIFEVNASSARNGKKILAQLQEATQSHQVSHKKDGLFQTSKPSALSVPASSQQNSKVPNAFTNFFKPSSQTPALITKEKSKSAKEAKEDKKEKKRKRISITEDQNSRKRRKHDEKGEKKEDTAGGKSELNLSSTSLILFEEVDIVFESDHGFWAAVQQFMATTKIPIILTTSDLSLCSNFDGRFDLHKFQAPSVITSTAYLQLVCLTEGLRTDFKEIYSQVAEYGGDIRRSLLSVQYWIFSGGALTPTKKGITCNISPVPDTTVVKEDENMEVSSQSQDDDDDEFTSLKPVCHRRVPMISDDESSNSMAPIPLLSTVNPSRGKTETEKGDNLPPVHNGSSQSLQQMPLNGFNSIVDLLRKILQTKDESLISIASLACQQYCRLRNDCSPIYENHTQLLPLPQISSNHNSLTVTKSASKKTRKRIKTFDLYDSEASNDGSSAPESQEEGEKEEMKPKCDPEEIKLCRKSIEAFSCYYDNMSCIDSLKTLSDRSNKLSCDTLDSVESLCVELELSSYRRLFRSHKDMAGDASAFQESICIPVGDRMNSDIQQFISNRKSNATPESKCADNVKSCLPLGLSAGSLSMDYLPSLRTVCKAEQLRKQAKVKRRFHHYLDSQSLHLKDTSLTVLCTSFQ